MRFETATEGNFTEGVTIIAPVYNVVDNSLNSSDKSFTVPNGEMWKLLHANIKLTTTATVGNRQLRFSAMDHDGNDAGYISSGAVQAASTTRSYGFMQGIYRETSFVDSMIQVPIPIDLYLPSGAIIRFHDSAAIDSAQDDMLVWFSVQRFKGC